MPQDSSLILAGDLRIDPVARTVTRDGERLLLTDLTFDLLVVLARQAPANVTNETLAQLVWKKPHVGDDVIAQRITLVRKSLGDDARHPGYIRTVRHGGYQFLKPVRFVASRALPFPIWGLAGGALVVVLALILATLLWPRSQIMQNDQDVALADSDTRLIERARNLAGLHRADETNDAILIYEGIYRRDPTNLAAQIGLSFALSTRATKFEAQPDDIARAETLARAALSQDEQAANAWHALGYALDAQGKIDEAISAYTNAIAHDPSDAAAMSSAAYLLRIRGQIFEALELEVQALSIAQNSLYGPLQIAAGLSLLDNEIAAPWWIEALAAAPQQGVTADEYMRTYLSRNEASEALEFYNALNDETRQLARLRRLAGRAELMLGNHEIALDHFNSSGFQASVERISLGNPDAIGLPREGFIQLAETRMLGGDAWPELRVQLAELYASSGDIDIAIRYLSHAIDLGWRDAGWLQHSPFLAPLQDTSEWFLLMERIERSLEAQRIRLADDEALMQALSQ